MKNFSHLLIKEIKELLNKQLLISLVFILVIFNFIGNITRTEKKKAMAKQKIAVLDLDRSEISRNIIGALNLARFIIEEKTGDKEKVVEEVRNSNLDLLVVIPTGFGQLASSFQPTEVETYSFLKGVSISGRTKTELVKALLNSTNDYLSNEYLKKKIPDLDPKLLKAPIKSREFVVVKDKQAEGSSSMIIGALTAQNFILPVILMMIIMYSAQMVITAIAMEKQNKTLETLLTVPVSRGAIVMAKMLAAAVVGLLSAVIYMYGFRNAFNFSD
ncbi:MAG: ABC transporter permease, partial [Candidatus Saccharicenans sp.]